MDKRELILARLLVVLAAIEGMTEAVRNSQLRDDQSFPVAQLLDADEVASETDPKSRPSHAPRIVRMTPEIYVSLGEDEETLGTSVNEMRAKVIKAVLTDATLKSYCFNGQIEYEGCATGLSRGRTMEAEMGVSFTFPYSLIPADL